MLPVDPLADSSRALICRYESKSPMAWSKLFSLVMVSTYRFRSGGSTSQSASIDTPILIEDDLDGIDGLPIEGVPPFVWDALIPSSALPVSNLLFHYPAQPFSATVSIAISTETPTHLLDDSSDQSAHIVAKLRASPLPPLIALTDIRHAISTAARDGYLSIALSNGLEEARFPLWMEKCITQMAAVAKSSTDWHAARDWLQRLEPSCRTRACLLRLDQLPWNSSLPYTSHMLTSDLPTFLGTTWLSDQHMNAAGDWINHQLGPDSAIRVLNTHFLGVLSANRLQNPTWTPSCPRKLDELVRSGKVVLLLIPVYRPGHWTFLQVHITERSCIYVDSQDPENILAPLEVLEVIDWYLETTDPLELPNPLSEEDCDFPVSHQTDGHSCGIAVLSAMAHVALGEEPWDQETASQHREEWFMRLSDASVGSSWRNQYEQSSSPWEDPLIFDVHPTDFCDTNFSTTITASPSPPKRMPKPAIAPLFSSPQQPTSTKTESSGSHNKLNAKTNPKSLRQSTLPFRSISREEWLEQERQKAERVRLEKAEVLALIEQDKAQILVAKRGYERLRKQDYRKRKREDEIAVGVRDLRGRKKRPLNAMGLKDTSSSTLLPLGLVAETSRPARQIKEDERQRRRRTQAGRPRKQQLKPAKRINWTSPFLFERINRVAQSVGYPWSPAEIVRRLRQLDPIFKSLRPQRISQWRDRRITDRLVWQDGVMKTVLHGNRPYGDSTRKHIFDPYPTMLKGIISQLEKMRGLGLSLELSTVQGVIVAFVERDAPHLFTYRGKNGKGAAFRCSEAFVRKFLRTKLNWTWRQATKAAQKIPIDATQQTHRTFLRMAATIRDETIDPCFILNADQTQVVYYSGVKKSYAPRSSKQVAVVGQEEKRAFTLMVTISQDGSVLPFQAVYQGKDPRRSLPKPSSRDYQEAVNRGFRFDVSGNSTYWCTIGTLQLWVTHIVVPYFQKLRTSRGLPNQRCILYIDCWSVHKSTEFLDWMRGTFSWIYVQFCPGGCTSIFQPCDALPQRVLKTAIKRACHADVVNEALQLLETGGDTDMLLLDRTVGTLRDRTPHWLIKAYDAINKQSLIKKSWALCVTGSFNLSHESLTSREAKQALLDLRTEDPDFFAAIMSGEVEVPKMPGDEQITPDVLEPFEEDLTVGASDDEESSSIGPESEDDWDVGEDHLERSAWWNEDQEYAL